MAERFNALLVSANTASSFACTDSYIGSGRARLGSGTRSGIRPSENLYGIQHQWFAMSHPEAWEATLIVSDDGREPRAWDEERQRGGELEMANRRADTSGLPGRRLGSTSG